MKRGADGTGQRIRANGKRVVVWVVALLLIVATGFTLYFGTSLHGREPSVRAGQSNDAVTVSHSNGVYVIEPADGTATAGFVFYPGGRVHPDAYLSSLAPFAARADVVVFIPKMPLNLAVFDPDAAGSVIARHPDINQWFVGGHSLGGAMACRYASTHPELAGLVLFAAYCNREVSGMAVLSVTGGADVVLSRESYRRNRENLPASATLTVIPGMNHSEFGSYTGQRGGQPARIGYEVAHDRLASVVVPWFENRTRLERESKTRTWRVSMNAFSFGPGPVDRMVTKRVGEGIADGDSHTCFSKTCLA
jgi:dienelactone hydrolase